LAAVFRFSERITTETLALSVASDRELAYKETFKIDEHDIGIALDRV
jgi:hypothetical protein